MVTDDEFAKLWTVGIGSERTLGRTGILTGDEKTFDEFASRFVSWLGGLPVDVGRYLVFAARAAVPVSWPTLQPRGNVMAGWVQHGGELAFRRQFELVSAPRRCSEALERFSEVDRRHVFENHFVSPSLLLKSHIQDSRCLFFAAHFLRVLIPAILELSEV